MVGSPNSCIKLARLKDSNAQLCMHVICTSADLASCNIIFLSLLEKCTVACYLMSSNILNFSSSCLNKKNKKINSNQDFYNIRSIWFACLNSNRFINQKLFIFCLLKLVSILDSFSHALHNYSSYRLIELHGMVHHELAGWLTG